MKKIMFFQSANVPWLIKLHMMGNVDICGTEFQLGQKPNVSPSVQFLTCVSNRAKFFQPFLFFIPFFFFFSSVRWVSEGPLQLNQIE